MGAKPAGRRWRCTTKPRGACSAECRSAFTGFGPSKQVAKDVAEAACRAAGCHTPGGRPHNCQCGHTSCHQRAN